MGAIGGLLGLSGGVNGTGIAGPQAASVTDPTNANQIATSYGGVQNSLQSQQGLLSALQAQNGINNQSQVYNQLQGVANGTGPNPAAAMLNQATGTNVANQAALMAGQRGAGANVGLIGREAAQQGANTQQNAVGQAATLQANQSLNAINSAGNIANNQVANQIGATNANTGAQQNEQQQLFGAQANTNNANVSAQNSVNSANSSLGTTEMNNQNKAISGVGGAIAPLASLLAHGGQVTPGGPMSFAGQHLAGGGKVEVILSPGEKKVSPNQAEAIAKDKSKAPQILANAKKVPGTAQVKGDSLKNDKVPEKVQSGSVIVPRSKANVPADAARFIEAALSKKGKK